MITEKELNIILNAISNSILKTKNKFFKKILNENFRIDKKICFIKIEFIDILKQLLPITTDEDNKIFYYNILIDDVLIGTISFNEYRDGIYIRGFEVVQKLKGNGTYIIKNILELFYMNGLKFVCLEANNSDGFWSKFGFKTLKIQNGNKFMKLDFKNFISKK